MMTPGARRILQELHDDEGIDLVRSGNDAYCGNRQTAMRVVNELLGCLAISVSWRDDDSATYYSINDTGRSLLRRPELETEIKRQLGKGPFSVIDDKIVRI